MKIDIYSHIMPKQYREALNKKSRTALDDKEFRDRANVDIEMRLRLMDRYPEVLQVLTVSLPPLEELVTPNDAIELSRIANDELAELLAKYPDKFIAAVACLPFNDMDAALEETDRAITQLGLKGVQLFARVNGVRLDDAKYRPLYKKMAGYDLPMWIHPCLDETIEDPLFGRSFITALNMRYLVAAGIFDDYPGIKFITHHCGAMVPLLEGRIKWLFPLQFEMGHPNQNRVEHFRKFYNDTATYGSTPALMCAYSYFGADHLLLGTDAPLGPRFGLTEVTINAINRMEIPDADKEKIFYQNAMKLLRVAL